jgi:hypothetical protein
MATSTPIETFTYPGNLGCPVVIRKTHTVTGNDICFAEEHYNDIHDTVKYSNSINILDYQCVSEFDISTFTRHALSLLTKKQILLVTYMSEALHSTYWNVVFDIAKSFGYKQIIWVDGGLAAGHIYGHVVGLKIFHRTSNMFFETLFRPGIGSPAAPKPFTPRTKYFLSLARLARRERIYFTNKILQDEYISSKGLYSCGWGESSLKTIWNKHSKYDVSNLKLFLNDDQIEKFPVTLNHHDDQQHHYIPGFDQCLINVVLESCVGFNQTSHEHSYSVLPSSWCRVNSDRLFFTEKTAKAFLMLQLPIFVAAPGYVNELRNLGFDLFDDIIDHSYDKEDFINKRCDMVFDELKRLINLHSIEAWNVLVRTKLQHRLENNFNLLRTLGQLEPLTTWINSRF